MMEDRRRIGIMSSFKIIALACAALALAGCAYRPASLTTDRAGMVDSTYGAKGSQTSPL
jgi:hypothetical protein